MIAASVLYVDDIFDIQMVERNTAEQLGRQIREINDELDKCLAEGGYEQNRKKQEVTPCLRNLAENRKCYKLKGCGKILYNMKHVGGIYDPMGCNTDERIARLKAIESGWMQM